MPEPVDLVVHRRVLFDEGVRGRQVGLGLVVVVVGDEVLHPVVGEKLSQLISQLGRQCLVRGDNQRGPLYLFDGPSDGGALPASGDPQQGLEPLSSLDAVSQLPDGLRLVPGRSEGRFDAKRLSTRRADLTGGFAVGRLG